jgi:hypothetical protein
MWWRTLGMTLALSGCSLMFIPPVNKAKPMECNPSRATVGADVVLAGLEFFPALLFFVASVPHDNCVNGQCTHHEGDTKWLGTSIILGGAMVTHLISAKIGFSRTRQCVETREEAQRQQVPPYAPYPYPPQPYPYPPQPYPYPAQPYPQQPAPAQGPPPVQPPT